MYQRSDPAPRRGPAGVAPSRPEGRARRLLTRTLTILLRENSSPLRLGAGVGLGAFVGMTPLYGFHLLLAVVLAGALRVNLAGAALGSQISNPFFAPFLVLVSVRLGAWLGFGSPDASAGILAAGEDFLRSWVAGGLVLGLLLGLVLGAAAGGVRLIVLRLGVPREGGKAP